MGANQIEIQGLSPSCCVSTPAGQAADDEERHLRKGEDAADAQDQVPALRDDAPAEKKDAQVQDETAGRRVR